MVGGFAGLPVIITVFATGFLVRFEVVVSGSGRRLRNDVPRSTRDRGYGHALTPTCNASVIPANRGVKIGANRPSVAGSNSHYNREYLTHTNRIVYDEDDGREECGLIPLL